MRRLAFLGAAIVVLVCATVLALPQMISEKRIRATVQHELWLLTGRAPVIDGPVELRVFPSPRIVAERVLVPGVGGGAPLAKIGQLEGVLSLLSLMRGNIDLSGLTLDNASITLVGTAHGEHSWTLKDGVLSEAAMGRTDAEFPVEAITLRSSRVSFTDEGMPTALILNVEEGRVDWPALDSALSASAKCLVRGSEVSLAVSLDNPAALLAGDASDMRLRVTSDQGNALLAGSVSGVGRFGGTITMSTLSLQSAMRWAGMQASSRGGFGSMRLSSPITIESHAVSMPDVRVELDGNAATGAINFARAQGRYRLTGTLDSEALDLSPYFQSLAVYDRRPRRWDDQPLSLDIAAVLDTDLRLSSEVLRINRAEFGRSALSIVSHGRNVDISIGEAAAYGGMLSGQMQFSAGDNGAPGAMAVALSFENLEMRRALQEFFGFQRFDGAGSGRFDIKATGRSIADFTRSLSGTGEITVTRGEVAGVDLAELMERVAMRPLSAALNGAGGRTAFETAGATFTVKDGMLSTHDVHLEQGGLSVALSGDADISRLELNMNGMARWDRPDGADPVKLAFAVTGSWHAPRLVTDFESLIRRSGATAPLLGPPASSFFDAFTRQAPAAVSPSGMVGAPGKDAVPSPNP